MPPVRDIDVAVDEPATSYLRERGPARRVLDDSAMRLYELLLGASLLAGAAGCTCPDGHTEDEAQITRATYQAQIDACLADDRACAALCGAVFGLGPEHQLEKCVISAIDAKSAHVEATWFQPVDCPGGRRPGGLLEPRCNARAAGAWLAKTATIEAASITAFARLVRLLEKHGAPERFVSEARRAILDEIVHARLVAQLAWRMGARVEVPAIAARAAEPTLFELARENAVEGQVAETFGALLATCQAQLATDRDVRGVFARIAEDEARHAALAHELAGWFDAQLAAPERAAIAAARRAAAAAIAHDFDVPVSDSERALLGIPDAARLRAAAAHAFGRLAVMS